MNGWHELANVLNPFGVQHFPRQATVDMDAPGVNDDGMFERHDARASTG
jgi:hypothetical protein